MATTDSPPSIGTSGSGFPNIVELNVGGVFYATSLSTLTRDPESVLHQMFTGKSKVPVVRDSKGKYFIDRDGVLFRYILDFLRNQRLTLPENFHERDRLRHEAEFFGLKHLVSSLGGHPTPDDEENVSSGFTPLKLEDPDCPKGYITVGYRGTFAFGRDGLADVKFRKLSRILVCGRVNLCREVFRDTLNESRDPDHAGTSDRYTARYFLKHNFIEQAFDMLYEQGFKCVGSCASGTSGVSAMASGDVKPGMDSEESRWQHYNEYLFVRE